MADRGLLVGLLAGALLTLARALAVSQSDVASQVQMAGASACRLPADQNTYLSEGFDYRLNCAPSTGRLTALMLFVDFPDQSAAGTGNDTPQSLHDFFLPAAAEWYANVSYGRLALDVVADTSRFYRMPARADAYNWQRGLTAAMHQRYVQDALDVYFRAQRSSSRGSGPGSSIQLPVDVLYIVPTRRATAISFGTTYENDVQTRVSSDSSSSSSSAKAVARKAVTLGADSYSTWQYKVVNHETGHTMCLPDLYPLPSGPTGRYVGGWDMMGYINGPDPEYFAWHRWKLGWLDDADVDCVAGAGITEHVLLPLEGPNGGAQQGGGVRAVVVRHNATAVLVAEARTRRGGDASSCAAGVLLYTVSTATETGKGPVRVVDTTPQSGGCAGDELNDAPLSTVGASHTVEGWGVRVTLTGQTGQDTGSDGSTYRIRVEVS